MSWRDTVGKGQASFRGVKFWVDAADYQGGRRVIQNEFPNRNDPTQDDVGRKARSFPVEGHVEGDDYLDQKNALIDALESDAGEGELLHPYYGKRSVVVDGFTVHEATDEGGKASFRIEFHDAPVGADQPSVKVDTGAVLQDAVAAGRLAVLAEFLKAYVVTAGSYVATVEAAVQRIASVAQSIAAKATMPANAVAEFNGTLANLNNTVASIVRTPQALYDSMSMLLEQTASMLSLGEVAYDLDFGPPPPPTTPERIAELANWTAVKNAWQRLVVLRMAEDAPTETFSSYDEALAARNKVTALIDDQAENASDDTFPALTDVRTALVQAVPGPGVDLPHLLTVTPNVPTPSILLAFQLYGSLDLEQDLIDRNDVRDPAAVFGTLQVLSNVS
jgi:prophage DNA circulation protein